MTRIRFVAGLCLGLAVAAIGLVPPAAASISALVVEQGSGRTISAANADAPRYPASLTKMMTLYLLFDALDRGTVRMSTPLTVSRYAASRPPSKLGLLPGRTITVREAILALATKSANDVAVAVAERLAGSEPAFAARMTAKARALGMRRTTFRNASGLHLPQQRTTARDMALLGRALLRDHPQYYGVFATRTFRWSGARYANHNRLMGAYRGMDGIKTGYTKPAGYNLVASASRNGRRLVGVVMGSRSAAVRNGLMASLLDQGFRTAPNTLAPEARTMARSKGSKHVVARLGRTMKARRTKTGRQIVASRARTAAQAQRRSAEKQVLATRSRQTAKAAPRRSAPPANRAIVQKKPVPAAIRVRRDADGA
ncbi:MAG: D-alanyl-D-alanine carboxypeptidase family protein [Rhodospirillales bacterium]